MRNSLLSVVGMLVLLFACTNKHAYKGTLEKAQNLVNTQVDSAWSVLSEITDPETLAPPEKADYGCLISQIHYKQGKAMSEDSLILYSLDYYRKNKETDKLPLAYFLAGKYYEWREDTADFHTTLAEGLAVAKENQDSLLLYFMYQTLADAAYKKQAYKLGIDHLHHALRYNPYYGKPHVFYNLGIFYSRWNQSDSSDYYIKKSVDLYIERGNEWDVRFTRRNYADHLTEQEKYQEALSLLYTNMYEYGDTAHLSIAFNYIYSGQLDSARFYVDKLKQSGRKLYLTTTNMLIISELLIDQAQHKKISISRLCQYNDSVFFSNRREQKLLAEKIIRKNQLEQKNLMLIVRQQKMQLYITWGILLFLVASMAVAFYIFHKKKVLTETEEEKEVLEHLLQEISAKDHEKNNFFKKIVLQQLGFIRIVANTPTPHNQKLLKQVSLIDNPNSTPTSDPILVWKDFYQLIDSVYEGFYTRLVFRYGELLSEKELQLCCLLCAGFSTKEISVLTGQKFQTIYQRKTTIRQKLKMDGKGDIVEFLGS